MGNTVQVGRDLDVYYANVGADITAMVKHIFASAAKIGLVNTLSMTVDHDVQVYHGAGKREGWGIRAGAYDVTAYLEGLWLDSGAQGFFMSQSMGVGATGALTPFAIGFSGLEKGIVFSGCRMNSWELEFDAEGWATNTIDIIALVAK